MCNHTYVLTYMYILIIIHKYTHIHTLIHKYIHIYIPPGLSSITKGQLQLLKCELLSLWQPLVNYNYNYVTITITCTVGCNYNYSNTAKAGSINSKLKMFTLLHLTNLVWMKVKILMVWLK